CGLGVVGRGGDGAGRMGASKRAGQDLVAPVGRTVVRFGGIGALAQARSGALAAPVAEAQPDVQRQPVRNAAETSGREKRPRRGGWMSVRPLVTLCRRLKTRGAAGGQGQLGQGGGGGIGAAPA